MEKRPEQEKELGRQGAKEKVREVKGMQTNMELNSQFLKKKIAFL